MLRSEQADSQADTLAVVSMQGQSATVIAASAAAQAGGVREGMTVSAARAILPTLRTLPLDDEADARTLDSLAGFAYRFAPRVMLAPPQTLVVDLTGCERLYVSEEALLIKVREGFGRLGFSARVALADNATGAITLALGANTQATLALPGQTPGALRDVPLAALRLEPRTLRRLSELGLERVGELLDIPAETLPSRFGDDIVERIRQLHGEIEESFEAWRPAQTIRERLDFTGPTNRHDAITFALRQAATFLSERLQAASAGATRLEVQILASEGEPVKFQLELTRPTDEVKSLAALLLGRFETVDLGERWYEGVEISAPTHQPVSGRQIDLFRTDSPVHDSGFIGLIDELTGKLGRSKVVRAELLDDPRPERAFRYVPFDGEGRPAAKELARRPIRSTTTREVRIEADGQGHPARWDGASVESVAGPERIVFGWWDKDDGCERDYYEVEDRQGGRFRVYSENGHWHIDGAF